MVTRPKVRWPFQIGRIARLLWHPWCPHGEWLRAYYTAGTTQWGNLEGTTGGRGDPRQGSALSVSVQALIWTSRQGLWPLKTMPGTQNAINAHRSMIRL